MIRPIPRRLLGDTVTIKPKGSQGFHGVTLGAPVTVKNVRIADIRELKASQARQLEDCLAVLFIDAHNSKPLVVPKTGDVVEYTDTAENLNTWKVKKSVEIKSYGKTVHHYEVGLT